MLNKVTGYAPVKSNSASKKTGGAKPSGAFASLLGLADADDVAQTTSTSDVAATSAIGHMLALQEISEDEVKRRKVVQQGNNMLEVLENLRRQLLAGGIPAETLLAMARQLSIQRQQVADPKLMELVDEIELRLAVEVAKLENAFQNIV